MWRGTGWWEWRRLWRSGYCIGTARDIREIARETGVARNTVRRYLRDEEAARYKPRPPRSTKLDPFKAYVAERLGSAAPEWIPASVLLMELRERGFSGGLPILKCIFPAP